MLGMYDIMVVMWGNLKLRNVSCETWEGKEDMIGSVV